MKEQRINKNHIEDYVIHDEERKRRNNLYINLSQVWYDLSCYYQISNLGNVRHRGKSLVPSCRNGILHYKINDLWYSEEELMALLP